jgi:hypothetical protein
MDGMTEGCIALLNYACGEKNKSWRPLRISLRFSQEACNDVLHNGHVTNYVILLSCDAMYDFVYLSVRRSVRDSH